MAEILWFSFISGLLLSLVPGVVTLIACARVMNRSFRSGWAVALGSTTAQALYMAASVGLYVFSGDTATIQAMLYQVDEAVSAIVRFKSLSFIVLGLFTFLTGLYYINKKVTDTQEKAGSGFLIGFGITFCGISYMLTYAAIYGMATDGIIAPAQGVLIVLVTILGVHASWLAKIILVQLAKNALVRHNWTNFNAITGWALIAISLPLVLGGILVA